MTKRTHMLTAFLTAYMLNMDPLSTIVTVVGGVLPDIDVKFERLKSKFNMLPNWLTHRGFTHWWGIPPILFLLSFISPMAHLMRALAIGWFTHILTDALTPSGVPVSLFNKKKRFRLLPKHLSIKYRSFGELIFAITLVVIALLIRPIKW